MTLEYEPLEYKEVVNHPNTQIEAVIIMLHGLGSNYDDFVPIVSELNLKHTIKFIFPNAPLRAITINNGHVMRAWYDITDLVTLDGLVDHVGIAMSVKQVEDIIQDQITKGIPSDKIILAGFSQGGVITYATFLTTHYKLLGAIMLSCYFPYQFETTKKPISTINQKTQALVTHGLMDTVVPFQAGFHGHHMLKDLGYNALWRQYNSMGHSLCNEEVQDIAAWISSLLH